MSDLTYTLPQLDAAHVRVPDAAALRPANLPAHAPRIALHYGSLRDRSFSRLLTEEAARLLQAMGAETRIFNPSGPPLPDDAPADHPKVQELRALTLMQASGGSQNFNAVTQMRVLGRWMRMITIPNQSSVAKAFLKFGDDDRMKPSSYFDRVVDVMEELVRFTLLTREVSTYLVDHYSERKETTEELSQHVNQKSI